VAKAREGVLVPPQHNPCFVTVSISIGDLALERCREGYIFLMVEGVPAGRSETVFGLQWTCLTEGKEAVLGVVSVSLSFVSDLVEKGPYILHALPSRAACWKDC